jgi:16S rRNA C1402 N4-methylase RsmH
MFFFKNLIASLICRSTVKREYCHEENDEDLRKAVHDACYEKAYAIAASGNRNKHERQDAFDAICEEFKAQFTEEELEENKRAKSAKLRVFERRR